MISPTPLLAAAIFALSPAVRAGLEFEETLKEIDLAPDERTVDIDFPFENTSGKDVTVAKYDAACSCMSVRIKGGKLRYAPGESGVIRAVFDMGNFSGTVDKAVRIWLENDPESTPSIELTARIDIPVLVDIEPKSLRWEVGEAAEPKVITVKMNHGEPIHLLSVSSANETFAVDHRAIEKGRHYEVTVTPSDTETPGLAVIQIATDCEISRHATQRAFAVVRRSPNAAADNAPNR